MENVPSALINPSSEDAQIWQSLQCAIARSSGFQRWKVEQGEAEMDKFPLEVLVRRYLRETLETLAY